MSAKYICDGCGAEAKATYGIHGDAFKPRDWYERSDPYKPQHACSRQCIEKVAKETGKTDVVLPI